MPEKVLFIQLRRIGDAVLVSPAIDALRRERPGTEIHLLTDPPCHELFEGDDRLQSVMLRPSGLRLPRFCRRLRSMGFGRVFDFQSLPVTAFLAAATGAQTFGFERRFRRYRTAVRLEGHRGTDYAADHKLDLLRAAGLDPALSLPRLRLALPPETRWKAFGDRPRIALSPVSPWAHKRWSPEAFARTAARVYAECGAAFIMAGGPGENDQVEAVAARMDAVPHGTAVFSSLRDLAAFLADADCFLGNDNGPRHMALALGLPTLGYFNTVNPTHWTPPDPDHPVLWDPGAGNGKGVGEGRRILFPEPAAAAEAVLGLLSRSRSRRAEPSLEGAP